MLYAIVRNPLGNTEYFNGYRYTDAFTPYWSSDHIQLYFTRELANEVASKLGEGIVVPLELHH